MRLLINCNKKFCYHNENCFLKLVAKHHIGTEELIIVKKKKKNCYRIDKIIRYNRSQKNCQRFFIFLVKKSL